MKASLLLLLVTPLGPAVSQVHVPHDLLLNRERQAT